MAKEILVVLLCSLVIVLCSLGILSVLAFMAWHARMPRMVYVFDTREATGYVMRVPVLIAGIVCATPYAKKRAWDWWHTPGGMARGQY